MFFKITQFTFLVTGFALGTKLISDEIKPESYVLVLLELTFYKSVSELVFIFQIDFNVSLKNGFKGKLKNYLENKHKLFDKFSTFIFRKS